MARAKYEVFLTFYKNPCKNNSFSYIIQAIERRRSANYETLDHIDGRHLPVIKRLYQK